MPVPISLFLLAALPIAQYAEPSGERASHKANGNILGSDYTASAYQGPEPAAPLIQPEDARLRDVSMIDPRHAWAVGDHGVILHTDDGGQHWSPQASGVTCTLNSVCFIDARRGWAAGGIAYPYLHDSSGIVLSTIDGGTTWQPKPVVLPELRKIRFVTERQGWAIGCPSAMFPGGAFTTRDAGRSWQPASSGGTMRIRTGDFYDGRNAILGGSHGLIATIRDGEFSRNPQPATVFQSVNAMQVVPPGYGWLAGDGGWVALTTNRGRNWQLPIGALPPGAALFDFFGLAVRGSKCWVAGSPGSRVFFTEDAGRNWSAFPTGSTLPLRAISFVDDQHGLAVGDMGLIFSTSDGGRSWRRQRAGGERAAVMAIASVAKGLPLELLARTCLDQGYLGVAEVLGRQESDVAGRGDVQPGDRLDQAVLQIGATAGEAAWGFPIREPDLFLPQPAIIEGWNRVHNGHGADALLAYLVRQIRIWRPAVILVPTGSGPDGLRELVRQSADAAVKLAADRTYMADQFKAAGCEPWNVERIYLVSDSEARGTIAVDSGDWSTRLGQTWADAALPARSLLEDHYEAGPALTSAELVANGPAADEKFARAVTRSRLGDSMSRFDVMSGIGSISGTSRRATTAAGNSFAGPLDGLAQGRQVQLLFEHVERDPQATFARILKGDALPQGIDASAAARLTFRLAQRFQHAGRWDLAEKVLALLIQRYPGDPLARWASVERFQALASSETPDAGAAGDGRRVPPADAPKSVGEEAVISEPPRSRADQALALAREIETNRPELFASPAVRYPLAAIYRQSGQASQAQRLYTLDFGGADRDAWWNCARGEAWLVDRKGPPPKPLVTCALANVRPHLDGRLDEAVWKNATPIVLSSRLGDDRAWPATVMLAHDEQYLYLAIQCRQAPGANYESTSERRTLDPDLSQRDRVDVFLDLDRGYATYYHLTIDHRGWAADAIGGERSWDPKWFVAAQSADGVWIAEAAIPFSELKAKVVPGKTIWALGLQRTVPGVGFQSWTQPAGPEVVPEAFGWLGFE